MKIFPNPARSIAYVSIPTEMKKGGNLVIRNNTGEIIEEKSFAENNSQVIPLDLSGQPNGFYNVSLEDDHMEMNSDLLNLVDSRETVLI